MISLSNNFSIEIFWIKYLFNSICKLVCFLSLYLHSNEQYLFKHFSLSSQKKIISFISLLQNEQIFSFVLIIKGISVSLFSIISIYIKILLILFLFIINVLKLSAVNLEHFIYNLSTKFNPYAFNILKF